MNAMCHASYLLGTPQSDKIGGLLQKHRLLHTLAHSTACDCLETTHTCHIAPQDSSKHGLTVPPAVAAFNFVNFLTDLGYVQLIDASINVPNVVMLPPGHPKIAQQQADQAAAQAQKQGQAQPQGQAQGPAAAQAPALQPEGGRPAVASLARRLSSIRHALQ